MSDSSQFDNSNEMPAGSLRSILTLLLFLHLVTIGIAILSNAPTSPMIARLRTVPGLIDYAQLLCMDQNYRFSYTRASVFDMGNLVEVDLKETKEKGAAPTVVETVRFPEQQIEPRLRRQRWDAMIWNLQYFVRLAAEDEGNRSLAGDRENIIPKAVGVYLMKEHNVKDATIRYRGRALKRIEDATTTTDTFDPAYEADLNISSFGSAVISQRSEQRRSAPAASTPGKRRPNSASETRPEQPAAPKNENAPPAKKTTGQSSFPAIPKPKMPFGDLSNPGPTDPSQQNPSPSNPDRK